MDPHHVVRNGDVEQSVAVLTFGGDEGPVETGAARAERLGALELPSVRREPGGRPARVANVQPRPRRSPPTRVRDRPPRGWPTHRRGLRSGGPARGRAQPSRRAQQTARPFHPNRAWATTDPAPAAIDLSSSHIRKTLSPPSPWRGLIRRPLSLPNLAVPAFGWRERTHREGGPRSATRGSVRSRRKCSEPQDSSGGEKESITRSGDYTRARQRRRQRERRWSQADRYRGTQ